MDLGPSYPNHQSLISLLKKNNYHTSFFSGYNTYFDDLEYFLTSQGTDFILNKQAIESKYLSSAEQEQNYWGAMIKPCSRLLRAYSILLPPLLG